MRKTGLLVAVAGILLSAAAPILAHHAFSAEFDQSKPIKMSGAITKLEWTNPHAWLHIDVKGADGKIVPWRFEMGAPNALLRAGWSRSDIKPARLLRSAVPARRAAGRYAFQSTAESRFVCGLVRSRRPEDSRGGICA